MSISPTLTWFAVISHSREEFTAERELRNQGYEVWLPLLKTLKAQTRTMGPIVMLEPAFPRYLFVGVAHDQPFRPILSTRGVKAVITAAGYPQRVHHKLVQRVWSEFGPDGIIDMVPKPRPTIPEDWAANVTTLRIKDGPLEGRRGLFVGGAKDRVTLLLDILGQSEVEIPVSAVEAV